MIVWIWLGVAVGVLALYLRKVYSRFNGTEINFIPQIPFFGNMLRTACKLEHITDTIARLYKRFPDDRFVGHFEFLSPVVMIKDLELIKQITVKDFDSFLNHRAVIDENNDPLFGSNLFTLKDQKWKDMRSTMSPAFTSSKIRVMVPFMVEVGEQMIATLQKQLKEGTGEMEMEIKNLATRYANDVIATCAFGLKVNSMQDENNEFYKMGKTASTFSFLQRLKFLGYSSVPTFMNTLKIKMFPENVSNFFLNLVMSTMKNREEHNIFRPDMINILMEAKKGTLTHDHRVPEEDAGFATVEESSVGKVVSNRVWSDTDLVAQAVIFFIAGFDAVASVASFLLMELALNPDCQDKLAEEIKQIDAKNGGFDYNGIQQMKYLDMVVSETLRKWTGGFADRVATKPYNLGRPNSTATKDYIVRKGEGVIIPLMSIHRDPEHYENPDKFDPERFSDENKHKIKPFTYLPFGTGPRNCIGSRFALCELKVMVYQLLQYMELTPSKRTKSPLTLSTDTFNLRAEGGHWLNIKARKSKSGKNNSP